MTALASTVPAWLDWRPCTGTRVRPEPLLFLPGWGGPAAVSEPLLHALQAHVDLLVAELPGFAGAEASALDADSWLAQLQAHLPPRVAVLGWSLGGMLAVRLAARWPEQVSALATVAANVRFVAAEDWPAAMAPETFAAFAASLNADPAATWKRFAALQAQGDHAQRAVQRQLRQALDGQPAPLAPEHSLAWLAQLDNRAALAQLRLSGLHLFGAGDALVPADAANALAEQFPAQQVRLLADTGHAPQLSRTETLLHALLNHFSPMPGKGAVARSFSRAARGYDSAAHLQRRVGQALKQRLPRPLPAGAVLDLGCGTGAITETLAGHYPERTLLGLDLAPGMIQQARQRLPQAHWVVGDAEALPVAAASQALIASNLTIQWCADLPAVFQEWRRVLVPEGLAVFTTLGPGTLKELRTAWSVVDDHVHVNRFTPLATVRALLANAGLRVHSLDQWQLSTHYERVEELMRELRTLGVHNLNQARPRGLTGRQRLQQLAAAYEPFREDHGRIPASWDLFIGVVGPG